VFNNAGGNVSIAEEFWREISTRRSNGGVPVPIGIPALVKMAFDGHDLAPLWNALVHRVNEDPSDAAALLDLSSIALLQGRPKDRLALQAMALEQGRIFRQPPASAATATPRVLAFMGRGTFMDNMPVEFLLEGSDVSLDMVYVDAGKPLPTDLPEHDVALVCVGESRENCKLLSDLSTILAAWPKPVINRPARVAELTRTGTWRLMKDLPGLATPRHQEIARARLAQIGAGRLTIGDVLPGETFPIIARPVDSHAGNGLAKLDAPADVDAYLGAREELEFCIAPFVDYRSPDGLFRKYRVALIQGRAFAVHMAISTHWMIHYLNADMRDNGDRRREEAQWMARFDDDFQVRHAIAFDAMAAATGLEYLPFDCGETPDGKLLLFETGTNMIVHSMDPEDLFAYKVPQMARVFDAFQSLLRYAAFGPTQPDWSRSMAPDPFSLTERTRFHACAAGTEALRRQ
jgi:hypothetical protein